jgi:hypothetical protein
MARRAVCLLTILIGSLALGLTSGVANAQGTLTVSIQPDAELVDNGQAVLLSVEVTCETAGDVFEAFVTLQQDNQAVSGRGAITAIECDGETRDHEAIVRAEQGTFHQGNGFASAYILVCDRGSCVAGQDRQAVAIR